jgi:hypothetical protein
MADEEFSADEFATWLTPPDALEALGGRGEVEKTKIAHRLQDGLLVAVAATVTMPHQDKRDSLVALNRVAWSGWGFLADHHFWTGGETTLWPKDKGGHPISNLSNLRLYDVRFRPADIYAIPGARNLAAQGRLATSPMTDEEMTGAAKRLEQEAMLQMFFGPRPPPPPSQVEAWKPAEVIPLDEDGVPKHAGGRPRKDFWEPLLVAAGIAIYAGFQPANIADVERWMADWLSEKGHQAGEVAVRQRARMVFAAYAAERDKN